MTIPRHAAGITPEGVTPWERYEPDERMLSIWVDTTAAGFRSTPTYFASVHGRSNHFDLVGVGSIYEASASGFRMYVRRSSGQRTSPDQANAMGWCVAWHGVERVEAGFASLVVDDPDELEDEVFKARQVAQRAEREAEAAEDLAETALALSAEDHALLRSLLDALRVADGQLTLGARPEDVVRVAGHLAVQGGLGARSLQLRGLPAAPAHGARLVPVLLDTRTGRVYHGEPAPTLAGSGWVEAANGEVPPGAAVGGQDSEGRPLYIARGVVDGELSVGWVQPEGSFARFPVGDGAVDTRYEVWAGPVVWKAGKPSSPPEGAIIAGRDADGAPVYVVLADGKGGAWPGCLVQGEPRARVMGEGRPTRPASVRFLVEPD